MEIEAIAKAIIAGDALGARNLTQDWLRQSPAVALIREPVATDARVRALSASLAELFADRLGQSAPDWAEGIGALEQPYYPVRAAETMSRLRKLCFEQSPIQLRRRHIYAPPDFLKSA